MAQKAKQAWEDFTAATVRAMRAASTAVGDFTRQHQQLIRDLAIVTVAMTNQHLTINRVVTGYRLARLVVAPYTTAVILAAEAVALLTLRQAKLIQEQARAAAQARLTSREYQTLANTASLTGQRRGAILSGIGAIRKNGDAFEEFGVATTFGPYGARPELDILGEAQAKLGRIRDPFARERQRSDLGLPEGLRADFNESVQAARIFGSIIGPEGATALDRIRQGVIGIKDGFLDAARSVKVFAGSLVKDAAEGFALVLVGAKDLFTQFREQTANDPRGRTGRAGAPGVSVPGARAIFGIQDRLDPRRAFGATDKRGPLEPGSPLTKQELEEQLALGKRQIAQVDREAEQAREAAIRAEARALELLAQARVKDGGELAQIRQRYEQYRIELGKTATAVRTLQKAEEEEVQALLRAARQKVLKDSRASTLEIYDKGKSSLANQGRNFDRSQAFGAELLALQQQGDLLAISPNGEAEARRDSALRGLDTQEIAARSLRQKLAIEQQKLAVEQQYIQETSRLRAEALKRDYDFEIAALEVQYKFKIVSEEEFQQKKAALARIQEINLERLGGKTQQEVDAAREQSIQRQTQLYVQQANTIQNAFERTIDALFSTTQSFGQRIMSILQAAFLTPLKQFAAALFTNAVTGRGGGVAGAAGSTGLFDGLLGAFGGAGRLGSVFTPGFNGGAGGGAYVGGGASQLLSPAGYLGNSGGLLGGLFGGVNLGLLGLGGSALGLTGAFKLGQSGSILGKSLAAPVGALSGLVGFGGLSYLFPSLVAAGPIGWIAAAGIGATVGLIGLFRKPAEQKAIEKAKQVYGVTINRELAQAIVQQGKAVGGIDIAIYSPQVREMIELYAMATGQRIGPGNSVRPATLVQSNGTIYQQSQLINQQPYVFQSPFPTFGGGGATIIQVQLSSQGTQSFLEGETVNVVANQRVATSQAVNAPLEWARTVYAG